MNGDSLNIRQKNVERLREVFPELFSDNELDWEKAKAIFIDGINPGSERYTLGWAGKGDAFKCLQQQTTASLHPMREESINFDATENIFIEGENLEVLKVLQKAYYGKIKCIIIDPPYNTGNDSFIYPDNFKEAKVAYEKRVGDKDEEGYLLKESLFRKNSKDSGHFHSNWLSMMYPRLFLAKNLLTNDGVIFVHIDDNEMHNLRLLMNEIFGEENFVGCFCWRKKAGAGADSKYFFRQHEYILLYSKNLSKLKALFQPLTEKQKLEYKNPDGDIRGDWAPTDLKRAGDNDPKRIYAVTSPTGESFTACWSYTQENFRKLEADNLIWWGKSNGNEPKRKRFLNDKEGLTPRSWIDNFLTSDGTKDLKSINFETIFDYPKPTDLIKQFLQIGSDRNSTVLDFFGGSGTTAQAVLETNEEDGGNRKFILVQLPEQTDETSEAYKSGYKNIAEVSKERIRRVIARLNQQSSEKKAQKDKEIPFDVDLETNGNPEPASPGFKVFKLSPSNFKTWRSADITAANLEAQLELFTNPVKDGFNEESMLYELMLKSGFPLTTAVTRTGNYYSIDEGKLVIALSVMDAGTVAQIIMASPKKVITLDALFTGKDELKTNTVLQMRAANIDFKTI
jgi:adenine-specific DNA-methyltransferase